MRRGEVNGVQFRVSVMVRGYVYRVVLSALLLLPLVTILFNVSPIHPRTSFRLKFIGLPMC